MPQVQEKTEIKNFNYPDEVRKFDKGKLELLDIGGTLVGKATFQPGWRWSESLKPLVNTKSCLAPHFQYQLSGKLRILMDDGTELLSKAGDVARVPSGHDAWVEGDESVVVVDFQGMVDYARRKG